MRQQDHRRVVGYFGKRRVEIVDADAPHRPEAPGRHIGQLIAETGQPERTAVLKETPGVVLVDRNTGGLGCSIVPFRLGVPPEIVLVTLGGPGPAVA